MTDAKDPLADPRRAESDELAVQAEQARNRGDHDGARQLFALAAQLEEAVAQEVAEGSPRLRSLLAISAVALWYKAEEYEQGKHVAYQFLADGDALIEQGRSQLEELVDRCSREFELEKVANDPGMIPVEVKLDGGRIRVGLAPASAARKRGVAITQLLTRSAEVLNKAPYRDSGEAEVVRREQINIYEAPARAASYGLRFYVASGDQQLIDTERGVTPAMVVEKFLTLAAAAEEGPEALRAALGDEQYARAFMEGFAEIAPDGIDVGEVSCSAPSWKVPRLPRSTFEPRHREALRDGLADPVRDPKPGERTVDGILAQVILKHGDKWVEVDVGHDKPPVIVVVESKKLQARAALHHGEEVRIFAMAKKGQRLHMIEIIPRPRA